MSIYEDNHYCWQQCCDLGPHSCICGNDCEPDGYTPITEQVREVYAGAQTKHYLRRLEAFDRWLDQVRAEERERIAQAIEDANAMYEHGPDEPLCPTACIWEVTEHAARIARNEGENR